MSDERPKTLIDIEIHDPAKERIKQYSDDFAESLIYQSRVLAQTRQAELVLTKHVDDAHEIIKREGGRRNRTREFLIFLGSALFGAFFPGFATEVSRPPEAFNPLMVAIYVGMGLVGISLFLWQRRV